MTVSQRGCAAHPTLQSRLQFEEERAIRQGGIERGVLSITEDERVLVLPPAIDGIRF